jgi:hypothetical protein
MPKVPKIITTEGTEKTRDDLVKNSHADVVRRPVGMKIGSIFVVSQLDRHPGESRGPERLEMNGFRLRRDDKFNGFSTLRDHH